MNAVGDAERVRAALDYDPETGRFTRKVPSSRMKVGDVAGSLHKKGYLTFWVLGRHMRANRVAWLHYYGEWPAGQVDHIDGDRANNAIRNLRVVDNRTNSENRKRANKNNARGLLGVSFHKRTGKFQARIRVDGRLIYLGLHDTPEVAHVAYLGAKRSNHKGSTL